MLRLESLLMWLILGGLAHSHWDVPNFLQKYSDAMQNKPVQTKMITSGAMFLTSDLLLQAAQKKNKLDQKRALRMAAYGLIGHGPIIHLIWGNMDRIWPTSSNRVAVLKVLIDQAVMAPTELFAYFFFQGICEGDMDRLRGQVTKVPRAIVDGWKYWPVAHFVTFRFVPVQFRVIVCNLFVFFWSAYLNTVAVPTIES